MVVQCCVTSSEVVADYEHRFEMLPGACCWNLVAIILLYDPTFSLPAWGEWTHMWRSEVNLSVGAIFFERGSLQKWVGQLACYTSWPTHFWIVTCFHLPSCSRMTVDHRHTYYHVQLYVSSGDLNSSLHKCVASALSSESSEPLWSYF